ncbi:hypothetical protein BGW80DRAFT_1330331 [Lactifluus volemus]|nr:hypothetical protein BGW80DRAFT_1330331 [Lactifluus volemus]
MMSNQEFCAVLPAVKLCYPRMSQLRHTPWPPPPQLRTKKDRLVVLPIKFIHRTFRRHFPQGRSTHRRYARADRATRVHL